MDGLNFNFLTNDNIFDQSKCRAFVDNIVDNKLNIAQIMKSLF